MLEMFTVWRIVHYGKRQGRMIDCCLKVTAIGVRQGLLVEYNKFISLTEVAYTHH